MASSLDSWAQEDVFELARQAIRQVEDGQVPMHLSPGLQGMSAATFRHQLPLNPVIGSPHMRGLMFHDPSTPESLVLTEAPRSPYSRIASTWVRQQAMPALARARHALASSLHQIEVMAERMSPPLGDLEDELLSADGDWKDQFPGGSRRSLMASNMSQADIITLAQVMSVLSSLDTLNVSQVKGLHALVLLELLAVHT